MTPTPHHTHTLSPHTHNAHLDRQGSIIQKLEICCLLTCCCHCFAQVCCTLPTLAEVITHHCIICTSLCGLGVGVGVGLGMGVGVDVGVGVGVGVGVDVGVGVGVGVRAIDTCG